MRIVGIVLLSVGCTDKAKPDFDKCAMLAARDHDGDLRDAVGACSDAVKADPNSTAGKAAAAKLTELQPKYDAWKQADDARLAAVAKAAAEQAAAAQKVRFHSMPAKLNSKIREQAAWDIGRGTVTPAMNVITAEIGQPSASYEGAYGSIHTFVWGAELGSSPTMDQIQAAPFSARMLRDLTCGDYAQGSIEFYSYGKRLFPGEE